MKTAGGFNTAPDKPSRTVISPLPTAGPQVSVPHGPTAAVAPAVPGDATATAVESMPTVGAAPLTLPPPLFQMPAAHAEAGGTVNQHDLVAFRQQEEEAAMEAEVKPGSFLRDLKVSRRYKVCAASPASNLPWPD